MKLSVKFHFWLDPTFNAVINAKINMKKLEFNQSKCVKLHISKEDRKNCLKSEVKTSKCVLLKVQGSEMTEAENEKYIGDVVSCNGTNDAILL